MGLKTILFGGLLAAAVVVGLFAPIWAVLAYVLDYSIGSASQWWAAPLRQMGVRFSLMLAIAALLGTVLNYSRLKLNFGRSALLGQEKLILLFLGIVWLSLLFGEATVGRYTITDHPTVKMTKVVVFVFLLTHVVTNLKGMNLLVWTLVLGALSLGFDAYGTPLGAFVKGRLEGVGGPDFGDANFLAAYMAAMLPLIGAQFLRVRWRGKLLCLAAGVFTTNAVVLCRSRGAFLGLAVGVVVALLLSPIKHRAKIFAGVLVAAIGAVYLMDPQFIGRMTTITRPEEERDQSAQSRVELAKVGVRMLADHPLGVGAGNFFQNIGHYLPTHVGKDAHNTYMRCATELGVQGATVLVLLIGNAFVVLRNVRRRSVNLPEPAASDLQMLSFGITISLSVILTCCLTMTMIYVEFFWWILLLPVCVQRALHNAEREAETMAIGTSSWAGSDPNEVALDESLEGV